MNIILGSGLIGCIARKIFGSDYIWIPFKKSRYFSHNVPLADNFIICNKNVDLFIEQYSKTRIIYKRPFSFRGVLSYEIDKDNVSGEYFEKIGQELIDVKTTFIVYDKTCCQLNSQLQVNLEKDINSSIEKYGKDIKIDVNKHIIQTKNGEIEYDKIISTIPLNALLSRCSMQINNLKFNDVCIYRLFTNKIDLEGADQTLVSDKNIDFYKVVKFGVNDYLFFTDKALVNPYQYFGLFFGYNFEIADVYRVDNSIPVSSVPDLSILERNGIFSVGSDAQHDDQMCVSSCVNRLLKLANKI